MSNNLSSHGPGSVERRPMAKLAPMLFASFFVFIWLVTVGLNSLSDRTARGVDEFANVGAQQYWVMYAYLAVVVLFYVLRAGLGFLKLFEPALIGLLVWAALTLVVSPRIGPALIDLVKQTMFFIAAAALVSMCRSEHELVRILKVSFLIILVLDVFAVALVPHLAIHQFADAVEPNTAGAWRGLHDHKNKFGEFAAVSTLLFFFEWRREGRWLDLAASLFACALIFFAKSKMALPGMLVAVLIAEMFQRVAMYRAGSIAALLTIPIIAIFGIAISSFIPQIMLSLFGDTTFSGRSITWRFLWNYSQDHKLFGSGFSSFFIGEDGPLYRSGDPYLMRIGNAHNSYLDMLVTVGWPGLMLAVAAFVIVPIALAYRRMPQNPFAPMWLATIIFLSVNCVTSIVWFQPQRAVGLMLAVAYFALRRWQSRPVARLAQRRGAQRPALALTPAAR